MPPEPIRLLVPYPSDNVDPEVLDAEIVDDILVKPTIVVSSIDQTADETVSVLVQKGENLYCRNGTLVRVNMPDSPLRHVGPTIQDIPSANLRETVSRLCRFKREVRGELKDTLTPEWVATTILARGTYPQFPALVAVTETPIFLTDGEVHTHGYDPMSGVLIVPLGHAGAVPACPDLEDARSAVDILLSVFQDFPFGVSPSPEAHLAAVLAWILTLVARYAIQGPVPFLVVDAASQAAGKGLLIDVCHLISTGRAATRVAFSTDQEEIRRSIFPILREGRRVGWFDEVGSPFGGRTWNALITAWPTWSDRAVRTSESPQLPARTCWVVSANNLLLQGDTARRSLFVRLEPLEERPEDRTGFRNPDLMATVTQEQPRLLAAAMTILRAFHLAGRPRVAAQAVGSFSAWDSLVRQAVLWAYGHDPIAARRDMEVVVDQTRNAWPSIVDSITTVLGDRTFTAKEAMHAVFGPNGTDAAKEAVDLLLSGKPVTASGFSRAVLQAHRNAVVKGVRLDVVQPHSNKGAVYRFTPLKHH